MRSRKIKIAEEKGRGVRSSGRMRRKEKEIKKEEKRGTNE